MLPQVANKPKLFPSIPGRFITQNAPREALAQPLSPRVRLTPTRTAVARWSRCPALNASAQDHRDVRGSRSD